MGKLIARHTMRAACGRTFLVDELIEYTENGMRATWLELADGSMVQNTYGNDFRVVGTDLCLRLLSSQFATDTELT